MGGGGKGASAPPPTFHSCSIVAIVVVWAYPSVRPPHFENASSTYIHAYFYVNFHMNFEL